MNDFKDTKVYTGEELAKSPTTQAISSGMASEQSQAVAKIQAALTIAAARPRDELGAIAKIVKSCQRKKVAEAAQYAYKRGGTLIEGPSIKLAQVVATYWGNIRFGFREIGGDKDYTEVEAFAWDLETNTEATRLFKVYHRRYTGDQKLEGQRDRYENMASQAQRRVRACIEQVVPDDVFETAVEACNETLRRADPRSLQEKVESMVVAFDKIGVSKEQLEGFLGHALTAVVEAQVITLGKIYKSIVDGVAKREEFFQGTSAVEEAKKRIDAAEKPQKTRKPRSDKGKSRKKGEPWKPNLMLVLYTLKKDLEFQGEKEIARIGRDGSVSYHSKSDKFEDGLIITYKEIEDGKWQDLLNKIYNYLNELQHVEKWEIENPIKDLHEISNHIWGQTSKELLQSACKKQNINLSKITEDEAKNMIYIILGLDRPVQEPSADPIGDAIKEINPIEINPVEELYALADQLWGQTAGSQLAKVCEKHGIDLSQLNEREANLMIDVVAEQLALTRGNDTGQNE